MDDAATEKFICGFVQGATTLKLGNASVVGGQLALTGGFGGAPPNEIDQQALVLCGPIIGTVTETTAIVLLEVDANTQLTCSAKPTSGGPSVQDTRNMRRAVPETFQLKGLMPGTEYNVTFDPIAAVQAQELLARGCVIRTIKAASELKQLRVIALSCDRPSRLLEGQENPWGRVAAIAKAGKCDVMLHLGDQVYTKVNDWKGSAMRVMDVCEKPGINDAVRLKAEREGCKKLQDAYKATWYPPEVATALSHSSHLMIWSDNDVANDFTVLKKKDGSQAYTPSFLRVGMRVYRMYQRQLWDPDCVIGEQALEARADIEEWHFHKYGSCGIFLIDMRGNRITPFGVQKEGPILSQKQKRAIEEAFSTNGLTCMLVCSEIPFVGDPHDVIVQKQKKLSFLCDHWPFQINELTWLLDLCFGWKAAASGREVIMLGGDIHVSVDSVITDKHTRQTIRHITTSPITNHVCGFYPALEGELNERYTYAHKPMLGMRTYCTVDLNFERGTVRADVNLVGIPTELEGKPEPHIEDVLVLCGPVIGTVTETTANILLEVDAEAQITCTAKPVGGGAAVVDARQMKKNVPEVFVLEGLNPGTEYKISFDPLAPVQKRELAERGCTVRTIQTAAVMRQLRIIALSCDRPARMLDGQENPWGRLAEICKGGRCDVMLHLGDQVYTKENDWLGSAMRVMDVCEKPGVTKAVCRKAEYEGSKKLQACYRATWYEKGVATSLSHSSHLMIWSDNDVANDFTILKKKDGSQKYTPSFLRVGMRVYRMYQRQLWDPACVFSQKALEAQAEVEEWHFHRYGNCGVFLIDMRGNRIRPDGVQKEGPILNARQKMAIQEAFSTPGLTCMLVCSEIPFVGDPHDVIVQKQKKLSFLADHWPFQIEELVWLLDLCFRWKSAVGGREVIMLGGDIHVSVDSVITCNQTRQTIRHITTSPITNHVCDFYPDLHGSVNERYSYAHTPMPGMRTYCTIDLNFDGGRVTSDVRLIGVPAPDPGHH